jgi:hypothetical protein
MHRSGAPDARALRMIAPRHGTAAADETRTTRDLRTRYQDKTGSRAHPKGGRNHAKRADGNPRGHVTRSDPDRVQCCEGMRELGGLNIGHTTHMHTDKRPTARKMLGVTCTQNTNTKAMRALLAENVPGPPGNVGIGPGTGWRSLRKICAARERCESGRAKGMHGQRSGTPARRRCRRGNSRRTHTGGQLTPWSRLDHA